jgi:hypothetical protein
LTLTGKCFKAAIANTLKVLKENMVSESEKMGITTEK